ncbi:MAG: hypothetical protein ACPLRW_11925 [Moorellales bacterium]
MVREATYTLPAHRQAPALSLAWQPRPEGVPEEEAQQIDRYARARTLGPPPPPKERLKKSWLRKRPERKRYYIACLRYYRRLRGLIPVPEPPAGLSREERERIERLARHTVKRGYRRRAEDYPRPPWVARSARHKGYYLARLRYELALREGYR